ncbi:MAG: response regulator [Halanaeroarchaeum sp.]
MVRRDHGTEGAGAGDGRSTVLVVDDEENITALFEAWLQADYEVMTANAGDRGLELLDDDVDVALLDRRMPTLSGDDLLERIREGEYDVRVAMVTAIDPDFDVLEMGFDDYLTKPVSREDLESTVETLLERRRYDEEVRRYYSLAAKRAALEASKPASELAESEEYQDLLAELDAVEDELDNSLAAEEDFVSAFQSL